MIKGVFLKLAFTKKNPFKEFLVHTATAFNDCCSKLGKSLSLYFKQIST